MNKFCKHTLKFRSYRRPTAQEEGDEMIAVDKVYDDLEGEELEYANKRLEGNEKFKCTEECPQKEER
jgi:hypothetical protein